MKERMKETKYGIKDGVGPDPRKPNFQWTVGSMICDCKAIGNKKKKGFLCSTFCFGTEIKEENR